MSLPNSARWCPAEKSKACSGRASAHSSISCKAKQFLNIIKLLSLNYVLLNIQTSTYLWNPVSERQQPLHKGFFLKCHDRNTSCQCLTCPFFRKELEGLRRSADSSSGIDKHLKSDTPESSRRWSMLPQTWKPFLHTKQFLHGAE